MFTLVCTLAVIIAALAAGLWLISEVRYDRSIVMEQRRVIMQFQDILSDRLEEYDPRIQVWLAKNDFKLQPYALVGAHGHIFHTRSSSDAADMEARADEAAAYFDRKQLMGWIFDD